MQGLCRFGQQVDEEILKERRNAQRRARAAAWDAEKQDASAAKASCLHSLTLPSKGLFLHKLCVAGQDALCYRYTHSCTVE